VGNLVKQVEFLNGDCINLIKYVDAGHINAVAFYHVDQIIHRRVKLESDVAIVNPVLMEDGLNGFFRHLGELNTMGFLDGDAAFVLFLQDDVWAFFVESYAETLKLTFNDALVSQWLLGVEHYQDQVASPRYTDYLLTTTLSILGTLNDTWQIEQLNLSSFVVENTWDASERSELICRSL